MAEPAAAPPRVAYLVTHYPALSHAFIGREVAALRRCGVEVHTFSVRRSPAVDLRTEADRAEATATPVLLGNRAEIIRAVIALAVRHPGALCTGLAAALRIGPAQPRARFWQLIYLVEAIRLLSMLRPRRLCHVHAHLANGAADVARLAVVLGTELDGPRSEWQWSLSMHGPTEFAAVVSFDLAAKVRSASFVACISDYCRSQLMALVEPECWPRLHLVHMGVDTEHYALASRTGHSGPPCILFVGRLVPEKGPTLLIDALARLRDKDVAFRAVVVGQGPLLDTITASIAHHRLGDVVILAGPLGQDELPERYSSADIFCLPSFAEGVPVVLMEAMATGLPVVTTRITGIPELVEHGVSGVLVAPGRADQLAAALEGLLVAGPAERERVGVAGRTAVLRGYQPGPNASRLAELFAASASRDSPSDFAGCRMGPLSAHLGSQAGNGCGL